MSSLNSLGTRLPAYGDPEDTALRSTVAAPASGTRSLARFPLVPFVVLGLTIGAVLQAEALVEAAAALQLPTGVVACSGLCVAAVFYWAIISTNSFVAQRPTESRPTDTTAETPTGSVSAFVVLCLAMAALLQAEQLVAAADVHLHPGVVACFVLSVVVLFNLAIYYSIYFHVARRPARRLPMLLRPTVPAASVVRSPRLPRSFAFLIFAVLLSASWFIEPFAAGAELRLAKSVPVALVVFVAALFNLTIHLVSSFFLPHSCHGYQYVSLLEPPA